MTAQGGACFWLAATHPVDMRQVLERLLAERIVIAPGELFSQQGSWKQHLRLSFTLDWSKDIAQAVEQLSRAVRQSP
jgi:DNA-binding transcriptional MocR family regulator